MSDTQADVIIVGAGLAGLVAACEVADRGKRVLIVDQENSANLGGQAFWSFGGLVLRRQPRAASARCARQPRTRAAGLARHRGIRPRRGLLAQAVGACLRRFRGRGEAKLAARPRPEDLPAGGLGRARRLRRSGTRQFGAAVPHHLGHRAGHRRDLRAPAGRPSEGAVRLPSSGRRVDRRGQRGDRGSG